MSDFRNEFLDQMRSRLRFNMFLLTRLPAAYFSGLRVDELTLEHSVVSLPFKWLTQNPFRSIYFASQAMAAELSTGLLAMAGVWKQQPTVSMLVFNMSAEFSKKATGRIRFTCNDGQAIADAVQRAIATGEGQTVEASSVGRNAAGEIVSTFRFTWTFKQKSSKK